MARIKEPKDLKFGRLTVIDNLGYIYSGKQKRLNWLCRCQCGNVKKFIANNLLNGSSKSCGCIKKERIGHTATDLVGRKFGKLTVLSFARSQIIKNKSIFYWNVKCDCGELKIVIGSNLKSGSTKSCGCVIKEKAKQLGLNCKTHGYSGTRIYNCWIALIGRCTNKENVNYKWYGGRGINVCKRWFNSFESFRSDMGDMPENMTIERVDNNGDYKPSNCRWATYMEQGKNKSNNVKIKVGGQNLILSDLARMRGVSRQAINCKYKALINLFSSDVANKKMIKYLRS